MMLFYPAAGAFTATLLFIYFIATEPQTQGGDFLGRELGLYLLLPTACIFGVVMLVTGFFEIKKIISTGRGFKHALLPAIVAIAALALGFFLYTAVTSNGAAKAGVEVEIR